MSLFKKNEKKREKTHAEIERDCLKVTLEYVLKENTELKIRNEDLKVTAKSNKDLLKEYIDNITDKDKTVQKMNNTIELLKERLVVLNEHLKKHNVDLSVVKEKETQQNTQTQNKISHEQNTKKQNTSLNNSSIVNKNTREESKNRSDKNKSTNAKTENYETTLKDHADTSNIFNRSLNLNLSNTFNLKPKQTPKAKIQNILNSSNNLNLPYSNTSINSYVPCVKCKTNQDQYLAKAKEVEAEREKLNKEVLLLREELEDLRDKTLNMLENNNDKCKNKCCSPGKNNDSPKTNKLNDTSLNDSQLFSLNLSLISRRTVKKIKKDKDPNLSNNSNLSKMNVKFNFENVHLFSSILQYHPKKPGVILMVDSRERIWEIVKRPDLKHEHLQSKEELFNIKSISDFISLSSEKQNRGKIFPEGDSIIEVDPFLNIQIKENNNFTRTYNSETMMDISKISDFNISMNDYA